MNKLIYLQEGTPLKPWQVSYLAKFNMDINEQHWFRLLRDNCFCVPLNCVICFYCIGNLNGGMLWFREEPEQSGEKILHVIGLHIPTGIPINYSKTVTRRFEKCLDEYAKEHEIRNIGFYTKRNPQAFIHRLNQTAPVKWELDSYVIIRKVNVSEKPGKISSEK